MTHERTPSFPKLLDPVILGAMDTPDPDLAIDCPRCGAAVTTRFYGPCPSCAEALGRAYPGRGRQVEAPEYEPKMNVTPNAVATRE